MRVRKTLREVAVCTESLRKLQRLSETLTPTRRRSRDICLCFIAVVAFFCGASVPPMSRVRKGRPARPHDRRRFFPLRTSSLFAGISSFLPSTAVKTRTGGIGVAAGHGADLLPRTVFLVFSRASAVAFPPADPTSARVCFARLTPSQTASKLRPHQGIRDRRGIQPFAINKGQRRCRSAEAGRAQVRH